MALPKRRHSISRRNKRRANWKLRPPILTQCSNPNCTARHLPHTVCPACGRYDGEVVLEIKQHKAVKE